MTGLNKIKSIAFTLLAISMASSACKNAPPKADTDPIVKDELEGTGWWCSTSTIGAESFCSRGEPECVKVQAESSSNATKMDECDRAELAACFTYQHRVSGKIDSSCAASFKFCNGNRDFVLREQGDDMVVTAECSVAK